jgi:hypothetical protein
MKFSDVTFPHPVLGIGDSVKGTTGFIGDPEIHVLSDSYKVVIECNLENRDLETLIKERRAEFFCDITCTNTVFRSYVTSDNSNIVIEIPRKQVKGKVEFTCILVVKDAISAYSNSEAHSDYNGYTFILDKGDLLAFFGEFSFDADIKYEKLKAVSSFMEVIENESILYSSVDLKRPKIEVQLPSSDYKVYCSDAISQEVTLAPIFHASLVLNALLIALYSFDEHKDYLWAKALKYRMDNEEQFHALSIDEKEDIPELAQRLLGNPFSRLLNGISVYVESDTEE